MHADPPAQGSNLHAETQPPAQVPPVRFHPLAIDEYGDLRVGEHFHGLAAEGQPPRHRPVRGHHDQIALSRFGGFDDRLIDEFVLDVKYVADDTG